MKKDEKKPKPDDAGNAGKIAGQMMKKDTATALLFRNSKENFAELFSRTVFSGTPVLPEELSEQDIKETAFLRIARQGGGTTLVQYRDVAMGLRRERLLAVLGLENQSLPDYAMPFRVLEVDFINYARQIQIIQDRHRSEWKGKDGHLHRPAKVNAGEYLGRFLKTDRIARCVTLVVYWGSEPWDGPMKLSDLFEDREDPGDSVRLDMKLLDVCRMTDGEICGYTGELRTVFGFCKYAEDKDGLKKFIDGSREHFSNVSETAMDALEELTHSPQLQQIRTPEYQTQEGGYNVCQGIRGMIEDGKQEGRTEGIKIGIEEGRTEGIKIGIAQGEQRKAREVACFLFSTGMSVSKIARAVGSSAAAVREWLDGAESTGK